MPVQNPKELVVQLLSNLRQNTEKSVEIYKELAQIAWEPDVKEALEARAFISEKTLATQDQCFKLIGERPMQANSRLQEIFAEDFRKELGEIQNPAAKHLYILAKAIHLNQLRIAEYMALVAAADVTGNYGAGVLLESCLADKLAFVERNRRLLRKIVEARVEKRMAA